MIVKICAAIAEKAPSVEWMRNEVARRLQGPLPKVRGQMGGARVSFYIGSKLSSEIREAAGSSGRTPNEIVTSCLMDALGDEAPAPAPVVTGRPRRPRPDQIPPPPKTPLGRVSAKATRWREALEMRLAIIRADVAVGRWGVFCITGGNPAVSPYEPLDEQGVRDFSDEIRQGVVVQEPIPWEYAYDEAQAWLGARQSEGKPLSWVYVSGDSESLNDAQEARRRGALMGDSRFPGAAEALAQIEREEALEREVFGRKRYYLEWARRDVERLKQIAVRDGIRGRHAVPENLRILAAKTESLGQRGLLAISRSGSPLPLLSPSPARPSAAAPLPASA